MTQRHASRGMSQIAPALPRHAVVFLKVTLLKIKKSTRLLSRARGPHPARALLPTSGLVCQAPPRRTKMASGGCFGDERSICFDYSALKGAAPPPQQNRV